MFSLINFYQHSYSLIIWYLDLLCLHFPFQDISFKVLLCEQLRKNWQTGNKQKHYGNLGREIESKESLLFQIWVDIFLCVSFIFSSSIACWPCCGMDDVDNKWTTFMLYSDDFIIWCAVLVGPCHVKCKCYTLVDRFSFWLQIKVPQTTF